MPRPWTEQERQEFFRAQESSKSEAERNKIQFPDREKYAREMVALAVRERGGVAIVLDGVCTDIVEIRAMGMPVFARGTSVLTTKLHGLNSGAINAPVACGGVVVQPGDVVLGDDNGVLVLPVAVAQAVVARARESDEREPAARDYLRGGGSLPERTGANRTVAELLALAESAG
jgi:4-hydroxy-4-methyl-2-oxoglutarate aldolase